MTALTEIKIKSFSKKDQALLEKDIRPLLVDVKAGMIGLDEKTLSIIDEVSPCRKPGIFITTFVKQGSGIRPSELIEVLSSRGLEVERPIKTGIELV